MRIVSAASAFPQHYYSQEMLLEALQEYWGERIENPNVLRRLHRHVSVDGHFLSLPKEEYLQMRTWGEANHHWIRTAKELGEKAVTRALADAGLHAQNLGAFFFVSVTGISSPSIDALLINRLGLCRNIRRVPVFGLGCVAGAAGVIVAGADCGLSGVRILATRSVFYPDTEEMMGWDVSEKGFRIVLSREIPNLVRKNLAHDLDD